MHHADAMQHDTAPACSAMSTPSPYGHTGLSKMTPSSMSLEQGEQGLDKDSWLAEVGDRW